MSVSGPRLRQVSLAGVIAGLAALASVAAPWTISIPPAHLAQSFGFQTPACWLTVIALLAGIALETRFAVIAIAIASGVVLFWLAWAMWIVTTPSFTALPFPFVGTDVIGPGWYAAAIGLLVAAGTLVKALVDRDAPVGPELWTLAVIPGYGLMRLRRWGAGLAFAALTAGALYFASTDSPDAGQFADYGASNNVPPPFPRSPEWILLGVTVIFWIASVAATIRERRSQASR